LAVAISGGEVRNDVLILGTFENAPASIDRLLKKLAGGGLAGQQVTSPTVLVHGAV
jgi:hypothetical protein